MVDLDKQFAEMADISTEDSAYDFVIDGDLRVIAVPERGVVLGVEGDKDVNRVRFRMNRNYRGTDLSGFNIRINYRSAEDEINYFPVTEKTVTDDAIYFVWLVGADTVAAKGTVYFVARFFTAEEDGTIAQEFNTTLGNARTLEGLVVDAQADDKPVKDLLAQLEYDLKTYTAPFVQQAKTYAENSAASADRAATYASSANSSANSAAQSAQSASADANSAGRSAASAEESANKAAAIVRTDKTLSVEGAPADAKAVGDALKGIKLPIATADVLGGVKAGRGLTVRADGTLEVTAENLDTVLGFRLAEKLKRLERMMDMDGKLVYTGAGVAGKVATSLTVPETADYIVVKMMAPAALESSSSAVAVGTAADYGSTRIVRGGTAVAMVGGLSYNFGGGVMCSGAAPVQMSFAADGTLNVDAVRTDTANNYKYPFNVEGYQYV